MEIEKSAISRGIDEIIHFTTNEGLIGILHSEFLLPNARLKEENTLEFIFSQNSEQRKERDKKWLDFVNFSITKVNHEFFSYSQQRRRSQTIFWVILSFSIKILNDDKVVFTTTNNIYPSCTREPGLIGFDKMFSESIVGKFQVNMLRTEHHLPSWTTCEQAEVLYPDGCSISHLLKIYVRNEDNKHSVKGILAALNKDYDVVIAPDMFKKI
ncbi:DarT ssDNA thymidine ADP-ribosyltransferase family protein [Shewanella sp. H8]|uniref:DarT ssDNA thymidine ADP-ribosyltransferase family protein n=1 Tax=Shewanella sp. H8 TaxID=3342676 RepID=UPI00331605CA